MSLAGSILARAQERETTFSTDVKVISLIATVRDKQGRIVSTLNKEDFSLTEDGRSQAIRYFSRETDLPLTLGLLAGRDATGRKCCSAFPAKPAVRSLKSRRSFRLTRSIRVSRRSCGINTVSAIPPIIRLPALLTEPRRLQWQGPAL